MKAARLFILLCLTLAILAGCTSSKETITEASVIGTWKDTGNINYTFAADHTGVCDTYGQKMDFKWSLQDKGMVKIEKESNYFFVQLKDGMLLFGAKAFSKAQ